MSRLLPPAALALLLAGPAAADDEKKDDPVAKQKAVAAENWKKLDAGDPAVVETDALLVYGSLPKERLTKLTADLGRMYARAYKALKFGPEERPWAGKLTVYVFKDRPGFTSFVRRVEGRSPEPEEIGSVQVRGTEPHVAVGAPRGGGTPEAFAGYQVCGALLSRKAGSAAQIPGWLKEGFGRATAFRLTSATPARIGNKDWGKHLARKPMKALWDLNLSSEELTAYGGQLADFFAYGPGSANLPAFLGALKPGDRDNEVSIAEAVEAAKYSPEEFEKAWRRYNGGR